jgi:O-antigen ligase
VRLNELLEPNRLVFALLFAVLFIEMLLLKRHRRPLDWTEIWMGLFVVMLLASVLFQARRVMFGLRVVTVAFMVPFMGYYIARRLVRRQEDLDQMIKIFAYMGLYLILIGAIERLTQAQLTYRLKGPFDFRDGFYFVMMAVFFVVLPEVIVQRHKRGQPFFPVLVLKGILSFAVVIIVLIWTRACWLGFFCGLSTFVFLGRSLISSRGKLISIGLTLLVTPIALLLLYEVLSVGAVYERVGNVEYILSRLLTYQRIFDEFIEHPFFGIGFQNLLYELQERMAWNDLKSYVNTHQSYLAILAEMGLVGFFVFLAMVVSMFRSGLRMIRQAPSRLEKWRAISMIAMLVGYLVPPMTDSTLYKPLLAHVYIYVWVGAMAGLYHERRVPIVWSRRGATQSASMMQLQRFPVADEL